MEKPESHRLSNADFLKVVTESFDAFLAKGTSRSTDKLKPLHGAIAGDIAERLGEEYEVWSQGYHNDKEAEMNGRYMDKRVDITVKKDGKAIAGIIAITPTTWIFPNINMIYSVPPLF